VTQPFDDLAARIEALAATPAGQRLPSTAAETVTELLDALECGAVRAAERAADGSWSAVPWVKRGILLGFRVGTIADMSVPPFAFFDKHTYPPRALTAGHGVRIVPGGSAVRRGAYLAPGVVCMPPMYVNVGAHIGELEPVNAAPVIIEDDVLVGGNCGVYEGTVVRRRAVLAAGVVLTRGTPIFDLVRETVYRADRSGPLEVPEAAVVVPGARAVAAGWGASQQLALQTPVIVKYRDERTDLATALESWLR
jgi:2,3,4,5-tetrahydropyridine-2-carboxylate N-succinyltransferase